MVHNGVQTRVRSGLEILLEDKPELVTGKRVALLCNPTSVDRQMRHAADRIAEITTLSCLLGPEHGVRGEVQDMAGVESQRDSRLGVMVHSLYGAELASLRPQEEWLADADVLVVDLQDVGSRYYTYIWTMVMALEVCAEIGLPMLVLDRPNPLAGNMLEGPSIEEGFHSFVGYASLPVRHGLTIGELAQLICGRKGYDSVDLKVVAMEGWSRSLHYDETDLPWVLPSPNMPTLDTALVYPGGCLLEGTNLSEGRGTTRPFEIVGAPYVDGSRLADALAELELPGVRFRALGFEPTFQKHAGESCGGVQLHLHDRLAFRPFLTGVAILSVVARLWPTEFGWREAPYEFVSDIPAIDLLAGGRWLREGIEATTHLSELSSSWARDERAFDEERRAHLIYGT
jgi:uncharacterized protein YbbC (DUF1343 family)